MTFFDGSALLTTIASVRQKAKDGRNRGSLIAGEHVLGVSNEHVPHEEGDLERSGAVSQDEATGVTAISYDTPYAIRQHEDESLQHDAGRTAKYLENALNSEREAVLQILANSIRDEFGL